MPVEVGEFGNRIAIWANKTKKNMDKYIQNVCRGVTEEIINNSPVDTGLYLGSWTPSINAPQSDDDFIPGPSRYGKEGEYVSPAMIAENRARAEEHVRMKLDAVIPLVNANTTFYLNNSVRYAVYVEYGGKNTPPYAVVRRAVQEYRRELTKTVVFGSGT